MPFTLLFKSGFWKLDLALPHDSWLEACCSWHWGYKFRLAAVSARSLVPFREQVLPLKFRAVCSEPLLVGGSFGPSVTFSKPAALQNAALFQTIPHPLLSLQC